LTKAQCGDCKKFQRRDCPRCEYTDPQQNFAACIPTDTICELFQEKLQSHPQIAETATAVEKKQTVKFQPFIALPDGRLAEQAYDGQHVYFLIYDPNSENITKMPNIKEEDKIVKPIDNEEIRYNVILQPSDIEEYDDENTLFNHIREYLNRWHEAPDILSRTLDILYCFVTYIADLIPQLPYRRYLAPWGKTVGEREKRLA
jgi:hypothetical protein